MKNMVVHIVPLLTILASGVSYATDCNSNCERHFDKYYQKPDLSRCQAEREAACRWGIEHCDLYENDSGTQKITAIIQSVHDIKNDPRDVQQCYRYIDGGSLVQTLGEKAYLVYKIANGIATNFNPYSILAKEVTKQILRCSCKAVDWKISNSS